MKSILIASLLFASQVLAHVEPGTYTGRTETGAACSILAEETYFENGVQHPLNERVRLRLGSDTYIVQHPALVDAAQSAVTFNHDLFQGVLATPTGGRALIIEMLHEAGKEGPKAYRLIDHQWRANVRNAVYCKDLRLTQKLRPR